MLRALDAMDVRETLIERIEPACRSLASASACRRCFECSEEAPEVAGLGIFHGTRASAFRADARVPHMGWNSSSRVQALAPAEGLAPSPYVYFAHSYYVPVVAATAAACTYTLPYTAVLESGNIFGVQFHPEKSGPAGLQIVRNFVELAC